MDRSWKVARPAPPPPPVPALPVFVTPQENESTSISSLCLASSDSPLMSPIFAKMSDAIEPSLKFCRLFHCEPEDSRPGVREQGKSIIIFDSEHCLGRHPKRYHNSEIHSILKFEYDPAGQTCSKNGGNWKSSLVRKREMIS